MIREVEDLFITLLILPAWILVLWFTKTMNDSLDCVSCVYQDFSSPNSTAYRDTYLAHALLNRQLQSEGMFMRRQRLTYAGSVAQTTQLDRSNIKDPACKTTSVHSKCPTTRFNGSQKTMSRENTFEKLSRAVHFGNVQKTAELLNHHIFSNLSSNTKSYRLLLTAIENRNTEIVELLLKNNCMVNNKSAPTNAATPLKVAVMEGVTKIVEMLLDNQVEIDSRDENHRTPLMNAIEIDPRNSTKPLFTTNHETKNKTRPITDKTRIDIITLLIKRGADVNARSANGEVPLHFAIANDNPKIVELLLNHNANSNAKDNKDYSLLHRLSFINSTNNDNMITIAEALLNHGANPNTSAEDGKTPLHFAALGLIEDPRIIKLLADKNADLNARDNENRTPLHYAVATMIADYQSKEPIAKVDLLLELGAHVDVYDKFERSPLHCSMGSYNSTRFSPYIDEHLRIIDKLLCHGADPNGAPIIDGKRGHGPLHFAVSASCSADLVEYILTKGADPNSETEYASTPLYLAAQNGDDATVRVLLNHGAMVDPESSDGQTILQAAVDSRCDRVVDQILRAVYPSDKSSGRRVKMELKSPGAGCFFGQLESWLKNRIGKNAGITENEYRKTVNNLLQDAYTYDTEFDPDRYQDDPDTQWKGVELLLSYDRREAEIVKLLIIKGVDIDFRDSDNRTMMSYAAKYGDVEITNLCLSRQSYVDIDSLNVAVATGRKDIVETFLNHDSSIDINAQANGLTPLICAAIGKEEFLFIDEPDLIINDDVKDDIAKLLVARGADVNVGWRNESALYTATRNKRPKLVAFLLSNNAEFYGENRRVDDRANYAGASNEHCVNYNLAHTLVTAYNKGSYAEIVKEMLEYNAKICKSVDDFFSSNQDIQEFVKPFILRVIGSNGGLCGINMKQIDDGTLSRKSIEFIKKCREEGARMKAEKIGDSNVSFYDIFENEIDQLMMYARNKSICEAWNSRDLAKEFPQHYSVMNMNLLKGLTRVSLIDSGAKVLRGMSGCEFIPELVIDCLFSYLDDKDIENLVEAGCNFEGQEKL